MMKLGKRKKRYHNVVMSRGLFHDEGFSIVWWIELRIGELPFVEINAEALGVR